MIVLVELLFVLAGVLALRRLHSRRGAYRAWSARGGARDRLAFLASIVLLAIAHVPLLEALPLLLRDGAILGADASSHAAVAQQMGRGLTSRGWVETYNGGFPLFLHYQPLSLLLTAALVWAGVPTILATQAVGLGAILLPPWVAFFGLRAAGVHPAAALVGGLALALVSPVHAYLGGWDPYLKQGLLSQVVAMPILLGWAASLVQRRPSIAGVFLGPLLALAHTQLAVAAFLAAGPAVVLFAKRRTRSRFLLSGCTTALCILAVYGPGLLTFAVPFSWPRVAPEKIVGFSLDRIVEWMSEGALLDHGRVAALTVATHVGLIVLVLAAWSRKAARAALCTVLTTLLLSGTGVWLKSLGPLGASFVEFVSPARFLVMVPLALALALAVAVDEVRGRLASPLPSERLLAPMLSWGPSLLLLAVLLPAAREKMLARTSLEKTWTREQPCGAGTPKGFDVDAIAQATRHITHGRVVIDQGSFPEQCPTHRGLELALRPPLGSNVGGPGTQVGVLAAAFDGLAPETPGSFARAEQLGIRALIHRSERRPLASEGWRTLASWGDVEVSERIGGTNLVGVGCVRYFLEGPDRALRDRLFETDGTSSWQKSVWSLTELRTRPGPLELVRVDDRRPPDGASLAAVVPCDARRATVDEAQSAPGTYRATVRADTPVDVVIRATAARGWELRVDGTVVSPRKVAPGFLSSRVSPGTHLVEAKYSLPRGYFVGVLAALAATLVIGVRSAKRRI